MAKKPSKKPSRDDMVTIPRKVLDGDPEALRDVLSKIPWNGPLNDLTTKILIAIPGGLVQQAIADYIVCTVLEEQQKFDQLLRVLKRCEEKNIPVPERAIYDLCVNKQIAVKIPESYGIVIQRNIDSITEILRKHFDSLYAQVQKQIHAKLSDFIDREFLNYKNQLIENIQFQKNQDENELVHVKGDLGNNERVIVGMDAVLKDDLKKAGVARDADLNLKNQQAWAKYCKSPKKPTFIPADPFKVYKNKGWVSYGDWLGNNSVASRYKTFRSFENAKIFVNSLNLKNVKAWLKYCKKGYKPIDIPTNPQRTYKNQGWKGWSDWLGNYN